MQTEIEILVRRKFGKVAKSRGKNGAELVVNCPFCPRGHGKNKLYINPQLGWYICQRCRESGPLSQLLGVPIQPEASLPTVPQALPDSPLSPGVLMQLTTLDETHPAIRYLRTRAFDPKELEEHFGVCYCSQGRKFAGVFDTTNTIILPIFMEQRVVGWQARLLYNPEALNAKECEAMGFKCDDDGDWVKPPKYWTSPGLSKGRILYNFDVARNSNVVVVTEGPFDAIAVGRCAVATLGKGVADDQIKLLRAYWAVVVVLLDPGDATKEAIQVQSRLEGMPVVRVELQGYKDAGDCPRQEIWRQIGRQAHHLGIDLLRYRIVL